MFFTLYLDLDPIGYAMMSYIRRTKIVLIDCLEVLDRYKTNANMLSYLTLLQKYLNKNGYDISYVVCEISNKNKGLSVGKGSQMFKKLFCLEQFGKVSAGYFSPPIGLNNPESIFEATLYIKSADTTTFLNSETYLAVVDSIYRDHHMAWHEPFMSGEDMDAYATLCMQYYNSIRDSIVEGLIPVEYVDLEEIL